MARPPCFPLTAYPLHAPLRCGCLFLVGCCVLIFQLAANLRHRVFHFHYFCVAPFNVPYNGTTFPDAIHPPCSTSPYSLSLLMPTLGFLFGLPFKFLPLKTKAKPITLFLMGYVSMLQRKEPTAAPPMMPEKGLSWTLSKMLCRELGP